MKERIRKLRKALDLTQREFAERIGMKGNTIATYEMGRAFPSDPTINNICKEFNVNEHWLRTGAGEMFIQQSRDEQIADFVQKTMSSESDNFKRRFISMLARLDENEWAVLEQMVNILTNSENDNAD